MLLVLSSLSSSWTMFCLIWRRIQDTSIKASSSLMDLRTCGINGDDVPKQITVHRQSSFSRKASSLKRFSLFVNTDPTAYSVSAYHIISPPLYNISMPFLCTIKIEIIFKGVILTRNLKKGKKFVFQIQIRRVYWNIFYGLHSSVLLVQHCVEWCSVLLDTTNNILCV